MKMVSRQARRQIAAIDIDEMPGNAIQWSPFVSPRGKEIPLDLRKLLSRVHQQFAKQACQAGLPQRIFTKGR